MKEKELIIKPYGDLPNDGMVQISFTLPLKLSNLSREIARKIAREMNLTDEIIVFEKDLYEDFSFYIIYGKFKKGVLISKIEVKEEEKRKHEFHEVLELGEKILDKRKIKIIAATIGSDAHTVGLDAIINAKGYKGDSGLERYPFFEILNLGAQVPHEFLVSKIFEFKPNAILISQTVTQRNIHLKNLTYLVELLEAENIRDKVILICGGFRITKELAHELGYDMGFGIDTYPSDVAFYIINEVVRRNLFDKWS
ncbi:MAG: cobalamin-dependent protein [Caldisericia bacterium]|nr:cobalamin-dependent protein [Caldisericia bacterium]